MADLQNPQNPQINQTPYHVVTQYDRAAIQAITGRFNNTNLNAVGVLTISFDELVTKLKQEGEIIATRDLIGMMHALSLNLQDMQPAEGGGVEEMQIVCYKIRTFLAAFMISYRPVFVFESMGVTEQELFHSSQNLTSYIESIIPRLASDEPLSEIPLKDFIPMMDKYMADFRTWKVPDEERIITRIKGALTALYNAAIMLPEDEPIDSELSVQLRDQIERLRGKFVQIRNADALAMFDAERLFDGMALNSMID